MWNLLLSVFIGLAVASPLFLYWWAIRRRKLRLIRFFQWVYSAAALTILWRMALHLHSTWAELGALAVSIVVAGVLVRRLFTW
jgi:hypothetical protein